MSHKHKRERALLRFARSVVESVRSQVNQQKQIMESQISREISSMIQSVANGVWRGAGSQVFVDEMNTLVLPRVSELIGRVVGIHGFIGAAADIVERGHQQACSRINAVNDVFGRIY